MSDAEKPGVRTTEFWLTIAVQLIGHFEASDLPEAWHRVVVRVALILQIALYAFARSRAKRPAVAIAPPTSHPAVEKTREEAHDRAARPSKP